ncbi:hypothetical protein N0V82_005825 [Gnomoniopsis sp. IMI 355080]|nr:hypothetical protein N0V82_005825 [Gnomoniopsis sp. IMI 355080]
MDHSSNNSPDPPDGAIEVAADEDSQESNTLQYAMKPLPDTQPTSQDYQQISPERIHTCDAPLISRPTQPDADDLSIGFSYDKPAAVKPGQFSGRVQTKLFNPIAGASTRNEDPEIPVEPHSEQSNAARGAVNVNVNPGILTSLPSPRDKRVTQETPETQAAQDLPLSYHGYQAPHIIQNNQYPHFEQDMPTAAPLTRKKQRFPDYQPTYRTLEPQQQLPTPETSFGTADVNRTVSSLPEHDLAFTNAADIQQNRQRHPAMSSTISNCQQKTRTSFQNDVSVSSSRPPRSMPGSSPRVTAINRPTKDSHQRTSRLSTPATRPRSGGSSLRSSHSIVKSNSKAKRKSHPAQVSSSSRSSSRSADHGEESPSMKQRSKWTPAELLQNRFHQKLVTTAADLAGCFNDKFADIGAEVDQHLQTISDLKKGMSKQRNDLSRYKDCILGKDDKIQQLEEHCNQLIAQVDSTQQELDARSTKVSKLEEKCRSYKDFLNNAVIEQQALYKATKAKCDGAVTKIQAEERRRIALQEQECKKAEKAREKLDQLVQSTVSEYKQKEREFNNQIEILNQKVQEREADVMRERETAQVLLRQNDSIRNIQNTLSTFKAQIEEVVGKLNEGTVQQNQQDDQSAKEVHVKVFEKLEPMIAAQVQTKTSLDALVSGVEACMNDIWEELNERQTMLENLYLKQEAQREQRVNLLQQEIEGLEEELAQQNQLFFRSEQDLRLREATINKMQLDMASLAQEKEQHLAVSKHIDRLREEHARLMEESATKASLVSELQSKLQESAAKLASEEQKHQEQNDEVQRVMEQQVAEARAAQVQAVEAAQQDVMLRMNEVKTDIEARLDQALHRRTELQTELDEAKEKMTAIEAERSKTSEKAITLENKLQLSRAEVAKGIEQLSLKDAEQQAAKEQQSKLVQDLQTKLASAEGRFNTLCSNTKSYDKAAQTILRSMKDWTQNYATIRSMFRDLRKNRDKDGILIDIDMKLKPLVELQLLQTAVSQYCQSQKEAAQMLSEDPITNNTATRMLPAFDSLNKAAGNLLEGMRRVTVMSPASNVSSPQPPSVQIEQERRRMREQPKSILKLVPRAQQDIEEDARRELLSNTSMNRGPYNRPVAGRSDGTLYRGAGTAPGTKRRQSFEQQEAGRPEGKSVKRETPINPLSGFSSPPERAMTAQGFDSIPHAPREAGWGGMGNKEQLSSPAPSQSSQEQSQSQATATGSHINSGSISIGSSIKVRNRPIRRSSNDPLHMFFTHPHSADVPRAKEGSQESLTHSQDVGEDRKFPILFPRYSFRP